MDPQSAPATPTGDLTDAPTRVQRRRNLRALAADPVYRFAAIVIALGVATLGGLLALHGFDSVTPRPWQILVFILLGAACEGTSLKSPRQHDDTRISPSNLVAFSALL